MSDLTKETTKAIDVLARWSMYNAVESWCEEGWENHLPDVGEYDYDRIADHMMSLLPPDVGLVKFNEALAVMSERAEVETL